MIEAISGIASGIIGAGASIYNNREANRRQLELYNLQYQRSLEAEQRQNLYNSPREQMKRLSEAGLNPNLVYGSGASVMPAARADNVQTPQVRGELDNLNNALIYQQLRNLKAEEKKTEAEADRIEADIDLTGVEVENRAAIRAQNEWLAEIQRLNFEDRKHEIQHNELFRELERESVKINNEIQALDKDARKELNDLEILSRMLSNEYVQTQVATESFRQALISMQTMSESERANLIRSQKGINEVQRELLDRANSIESTTEGIKDTKWYGWASSILDLLGKAVGITGNVANLISAGKMPTPNKLVEIAEIKTIK